MLTGPLVVEFIDEQDAIFVAETDEITAVGVVRSADMVHTKLLNQLQALLDSLGVGRSTEGSQRVVIGIALQDYLLAIKFQSEIRTELYGADAEVIAYLVGNRSIFTQ